MSFDTQLKSLFDKVLVIDIHVPRFGPNLMKFSLPGIYECQTNDAGITHSHPGYTRHINEIFIWNKEEFIRKYLF